ncbi:hypothetical protein BDR04DRAFT_1144229 [Suillus decipiens]|nr:hypothetical protein BDR04DRAFT_1144229 [Suillus decipiens]
MMRRQANWGTNNPLSISTQQNSQPTMANMIESGCYNICNVMYSDRYICMSGNHEFVGHDVPDKFFVHVVDKVKHLATLKDTATGLYLTLDPETHKVVGKTEPEVLQLSSEDGYKFVIHPQNVNQVAYLKDNGNWSWIYVGPAPQEDRKYWTFQTTNYGMSVRLMIQECTCTTYSENGKGRTRWRRT